MMTYVVLNIVVLALVAVTLRIKPRRPSKAAVITLVSLVALTAVFDNIMIALSLFEYEPTKILGIKLFHAPIEDFMYAVLAALLIPTLWNRLGGKHAG